MYKIPLKPLSLNGAYRGRRFKTKGLEVFKQTVALLTPPQIIPAGKLEALYIFGVSSKQSDVDNLVKCFQDALAEKLGFNDKQIYKIVVEKVDVKKGSEYCSFELKTYSPDLRSVS